MNSPHYFSVLFLVFDAWTQLSFCEPLLYQLNDDNDGSKILTLSSS